MNWFTMKLQPLGVCLVYKSGVQRPVPREMSPNILGKEREILGTSPRGWRGQQPVMVGMRQSRMFRPHPLSASRCSISHPGHLLILTGLTGRRATVVRIWDGGVAGPRTPLVHALATTGRRSVPETPTYGGPRSLGWRNTTSVGVGGSSGVL
jgi:hypothetical protein